MRELQSLATTIRVSAAMQLPLPMHISPMRHAPRRYASPHPHTRLTTQLG